MPDSSAPRRVRSTLDPSLQARIVRRVPMHYADGTCVDTDRPGHVRAASSMAWVGNRIALVQDDVNFVALVDPHTGLADAIVLPAGKDDKRQFDVERGNKKHKMDIEALTRVPSDRGIMLVAFGSGSRRKRRDNLLTLGFTQHGERPEHESTSLVSLPELYAALRSQSDFAGSDMNIEGAIYIDGMIRLFGRGNGDAADDLHPLDATCDISWTALQAYIARPESENIPDITCITQYALGDVEGVALGFTDAILFDEAHVMYSAAAEASKDAESDGEVGGSVLGVIPHDTRAGARYAPIVDERGAPFDGKIEGLVRDPSDPMRALVVVDVDDHRRPSELCEIVLSGPWSGH